VDTFDFRVRFNFGQQDHINEPAEQIVVAEDEGGSQLLLKSGESGVAIKDRSAAALFGGPYDSEEAARTAAERARRALLIWAVRERVGIDLGDGKRRGGLTNHGREYFEAQLGVPIRDDVHGVDVFAHRENQRFFKINMSASVGKSSTTFVEMVAKHFSQPLDLSEKQVVAGELYCSSFFDVSFRSRFITLVTAIEALIETQPRTREAVDLVDQLVNAVIAANIDEATRSAIKGSLQWLRRESIGQGGRRLTSDLLSGREYDARQPEKFFSFCYELRSEILHDGRVHDQSIDIHEAANTLSRFVADLLLASFGVPNPFNPDGSAAVSAPPSNSA
jgi:hypothetical protein